jgi:two-component system LytT family response regulator
MLRSLLSTISVEVEVVGEASSVKSAVKAIYQYKPNLVLLDIEMPEEDGFKLFSHFEEVPFYVIFVTAIQHRALDAFRVAALDYLVKPIDTTLLEESVNRVYDKLSSQHIQEQLMLVREHLQEKTPKRIAITSNDQIEFIALNTINYLKAAGTYTEFHLLSGKQLIATKPIGDFAYLDTYPSFMKTHRSYIVNLHEVNSYQKSDGGYIRLNNGDQVGISRFKKTQFIEAMSQL